MSYVVNILVDGRVWAFAPWGGSVSLLGVEVSSTQAYSVPVV